MGKVRKGAMHMTQEQMAAQRVAAFSRRIALATSHKMVPASDFIVRVTGERRVMVERGLGERRDMSELVIVPAKAPWLYPEVAS